MVELRKALGMVKIELEKGYDSEKVSRRIKKLDDLKDLYEVSGKYDIVAIFYGEKTPNLNEKIDQIRKMKGVSDTDTQIIMKDYQVNREKLKI